MPEFTFKPGANAIRILSTYPPASEHYIYDTPAEETAYRLGGIAAINRLRQSCGHTETHMTITDTGPSPTPASLHVVGRRSDGSYETFTLPHVPDGEGLDTAAEACTARRLEYIHCSRPRLHRHG